MHAYILPRLAEVYTEYSIFAHIFLPNFSEIRITYRDTISNFREGGGLFFFFCLDLLMLIELDVGPTAEPYYDSK